MLFLDTVTGKTVVANSLHHIPGNIVNRGLSSPFIQLNTVALEYARLVNQLKTFKHNNTIAGTSNTIKAIHDLQDHL